MYSSTQLIIPAASRSSQQVNVWLCCFQLLCVTLMLLPELDAPCHRYQTPHPVGPPQWPDAWCTNLCNNNRLPFGIDAHMLSFTESLPPQLVMYELLLHACCSSSTTLTQCLLNLMCWHTCRRISLGRLCGLKLVAPDVRQ